MLVANVVVFKKVMLIKCFNYLGFQPNSCLEYNTIETNLLQIIFDKKEKICPTLFLSSIQRKVIGRAAALKPDNQDSTLITFSHVFILKFVQFVCFLSPPSRRTGHSLLQGEEVSRGLGLKT